MLTAPVAKTTPAAVPPNRSLRTDPERRVVIEVGTVMRSARKPFLVNRDNVI